MKFKRLSSAIKIAVALAGGGWSATAQLGNFSDCSSNPDPHFSTWDGTYYDYHGGCYLVLVQNATVDIHMRTALAVGFSYIDKVGLRVGVDTADILVNTAGSGIPATLGGYPFTYTSGQYDQYELTLSNGQYVRVSSWGDSLSVHVHGLAADFGTAVGMCGTWGVPGLIDRLGSTLATGLAMGLEWKVGGPDGPFIGNSTDCEDPIPHGGACTDTLCLCQAPGECACFDYNNTCLCEANCVEQSEVTQACQSVEDDDQRANCEFDVLTTGDVTYGDAPFYKELAPPVSNGWCAAMDDECEGQGGTCVFDCVDTCEFKCNSQLCGETDDADPPPPPSGGGDRCACQIPQGVAKAAKRGCGGKSEKKNDRKKSDSKGKGKGKGKGKSSKLF